MDNFVRVLTPLDSEQPAPKWVSSIVVLFQYVMPNLWSPRCPRFGGSPGKRTYKHLLINRICRLPAAGFNSFHRGFAAARRPLSVRSSNAVAAQA